jgi:uridine kinase
VECPSSIQLATLVVQRLLARPAPGCRARVLGISGYPFTGKTHLADAIQTAWPSREVTLLPTESVILSRSERRLHHTDGCSPDGHDMQRLVEQITFLRNGQSITSDHYSWILGRASGATQLQGLGSAGLLIIDGTTAAAPAVLEQCDLAIFLSPVDETKWLPLACLRDVNERGWLAVSALSQNLSKKRTSVTLRDTARRSLCVNVCVDPASWTFYLPGCYLCEKSRRDIPTQAPVSVAICKVR